MADQTLPQNYLVIVDTSVEASSSFNAACWIVRSLNLALPPEMERKNKVFLLHLSSLKTKGLFSSTDKKEEKSKEQERCCKSVLAWFGRRMGAFDIHYSLIGIFCEGKSNYMDKIHMLIDRFDIGAVFIGDPELPVHTANIRANVFKMNRRMGFVWDKSFLKSSIHNADISQLKSYDESTGLCGYEAKLETDYVEYRFLVAPTYTEFEKSVIVAETCGQPVPIGAKEELIRKASLEHIPEPEGMQQGRKVSRAHSLKEEKREQKEMAREEHRAEHGGGHLHADEGWERKEKLPATGQTGIPIAMGQEVPMERQGLGMQPGMQQQPGVGLQQQGLGVQQQGLSMQQQGLGMQPGFASQQQPGLSGQQLPSLSGQQQLPPVSGGVQQQGFQQQQPGQGVGQSQEREKEMPLPQPMQQQQPVGQEPALEKKAQMQEAEELRGSGVQRDVSSV